MFDNLSSPGNTSLLLLGSVDHEIEANSVTGYIIRKNRSWIYSLCSATLLCYYSIIYSSWVSMNQNQNDQIYQQREYRQNFDIKNLFLKFIGVPITKLICAGESSLKMYNITWAAIGMSFVDGLEGIKAILFVVI